MTGEENQGIRVLALWAVLILLTTSTGCSRQWRQKFIRKQKNVAPPQAILVLQPDAKAIFPPEARYRERFAFWKSWHSELLASYGKSRKRDLKYISGTIGELQAMLGLLSGDRAEQLRELVLQMSEIEDAWQETPEPWRPRVSERTRLEKLKRSIEKDFAYSDVKDAIVLE